MADDREFYEQLNRVSEALVWEGNQPLPSLDELDGFRQMLSELASEPSTASDRERLAGLRAVHAQLSRLAELVPVDRWMLPVEVN